MAVALTFVIFTALCIWFILIQEKRYKRWYQSPAKKRVELITQESQDIEYKLRRLAAGYQFADIVVTSGNSVVLKTAELMSRRFLGIETNRQNLH